VSLGDVACSSYRDAAEFSSNMNILAGSRECVL
jgi:hypothetical protein